MTDEFKSLAIGPNENPDYIAYLGKHLDVDRNKAKDIVRGAMYGASPYKLAALLKYYLSGQLNGTGDGTAWHKKMGVA